MDRKIMTTTTLSKPAEASAFSFIEDAIKGFRRSRLRAAQRKYLLSLDDPILRDMGLTRLDVLHGDF
jgi:uncharacterized protein YjiS (DUF1127 family)